MKTFNCPFCKEKMRRELLVKHIEKEHDEEIPEGFTAYRLVYDIVNDHPDHKGTCTICGKPTKWNEKRQKYERLCGDPKCYAAVKKTYQKRMLKVYNKTSLMDDPNHLEKMLAGRKISGKYKWSDGKVFTYTGTYEKNFMEFLDKVLEFKSNEILAPGPVLNYEYKGKQHMWITDFLILPYNLIVEIKDGGEGENANPNMKYMPSYRKKQVAKEKMITNLGKYSYIRLTNNEFNQFLSLLAELKMNVNDKDDKPLYRIHEDACLLDENFLSGYKNNIVGEKFHHSPQKRTSVYNNIIRVFKKLKDKLERYYKTDGKNTYDSVITIGCSNKKEYNDFINCPEDKVKGNKVSIGTFKIKKDINAPIIGKLLKLNDNKIRSELLKYLKTELGSMTKEFSIITEEKDNIIIYYLKENIGTGFHKYVEEVEDIFGDIDNDFDNEFKRQADDMERMEKNARKVLDQLADKHSKSFVVNKTSYTTTDPDERELTVVNIYTPKVKMANKNSKKRFKEMCYSLKEELDSIHSDQYDIVSFFEDPDNVNEGYVVGIASKTSK